VTLVQAADRLLPRIDAEAALLVEEGLSEDGIDLRLGAQVAAVDGSEGVLGGGSRGGFTRLLVAAGRPPTVGGLEELGLTIGRGGIKVDERMRAAENVWAIGDVTGIALFTHVGKYHARIAAYDMVGRDVRADHRAIPATVFTDPQVACVGTLDGGKT